MKEERLRILGMLHQGKITVEEGERLLEALEKSFQGETAAGPAEVRTVPPSGDAGGRLQRKNFSSVRLTQTHLQYMRDGTSYENFGTVEIAPDVPEELLSRKIGSYKNFGETVGPARLLALLQDRGDNFGEFVETDDSREQGPERGD